MSKTIVYDIDVQFGDCDPVGIVFFTNYSRWMDAASHHYFLACGLPPWRAMADRSSAVVDHARELIGFGACLDACGSRFVRYT